MYLVNRTVGEFEIQKFATYEKVTLKTNKGFKVNESSVEEVNYYKELRKVGCLLMDDETYFKLNGIKNNPTPAKVETPKEEDKPKEEKKPYVKPTVTEVTDEEEKAKIADKIAEKVKAEAKEKKVEKKVEASEDTKKEKKPPTN